MPNRSTLAGGLEAAATLARLLTEQRSCAIADELEQHLTIDEIQKNPYLNIDETTLATGFSTVDVTERERRDASKELRLVVTLSSQKSLAKALLDYLWFVDALKPVQRDTKARTRRLLADSTALRRRFSALMALVPQSSEKLAVLRAAFASARHMCNAKGGRALWGPEACPQPLTCKQNGKKKS